MVKAITPPQQSCYHEKDFRRNAAHQKNNDNYTKIYMYNEKVNNKVLNELLNLFVWQ